MPGFDLALAIGIADATRQADHAVVREHVAIERIERRLVDIGREHALFEIVEDDRPRRAAETPKRALVELGPRLRARLPRQQPHGFPRVRERQDKEPRPSVLARLRMADHRPLAVVDLGFLARRGGDDDARLRRRGAPELPDEAADTRIARGEADLVDEVLPDRHRIAAEPHGRFDALAMRLARTARGARATAPSRWTPRATKLRDLPGGRWTPPAKLRHLPSLRSGDPDRAPPGPPLAGSRVTVARSTCTAAAMRLTGHPSWPSARTCCCLVCSKTLLIRAKDTRSIALVNVSAVVS